MAKETYLEVFIKTLEAKAKKEPYEIRYRLVQNEDIDIRLMSRILPQSGIPADIVRFYNTIEVLIFIAPRHLEIYSIDELKQCAEHKHLIVFGAVDEIPVAYDTRWLNVAGSWDIVNAQNGYVITKTLASFYTNKLWAWIDRGKPIWVDPIF